MSFDLSILVLAIPLFMFLFLGIAGVKMGKKATGWIGTASMLVTLVICYGTALTYFFGTPLVNGVPRLSPTIGTGSVSQASWWHAWACSSTPSRP